MSFIMSSEMLEVFKTMRRLGMLPMRALMKWCRECDAGVIGIGDNGMEAVDHLMKSSFKNVAYLVLHRDAKKLRQTKADAIALEDDSWKGIEGWMTAPIEYYPISYQKFYFYCDLILQGERPAFVLADFSESLGRKTAPAAAREEGMFLCPGKIAVVHVPHIETRNAGKKVMTEDSDLKWCLQSLCEHARVVIVMGDDPSAALGTATANAVAKRQSDFVGDLLGALQGGEDATSSWQEVMEFLFVRRSFWQAWSSEAADVRSAMADVQRVLSRGGALQAAKRVFVMVTGKEGELSLSAVQKTMDELSALLDKEAEVLLHVNSEKEFDAGVRINMAVQVERLC